MCIGICIYVCILYMYIRIVWCVCDMSMCVYAYICLCGEQRSKRSGVSPNCSPFYSLCPSPEPESCLLDRTGWQVDSRSPRCLLCLLSWLQKHCTVSSFHWVLGGSNSGLPAYTPSTIPTEPSLLFHNFLLDRNHLTGQPHRQCEWTQKLLGHTQASVCN